MNEWTQKLILLALLLTGCADPVDQQLAALRQQTEQGRVRFQQQQEQWQKRQEQQRAEYQQARRARNEAWARMVAHHEEAYHKRLDAIRRLPPEEQDAAFDQLKRDEDDWFRDVSAELDREGHDLNRDEMIDEQRDLTDAIKELSGQIEQARMDLEH